MKQWSSLISGLAGSIALTLLHETLRKNVVAAPRMDKLGRQALAKAFLATGSEVPPAEDLQKLALSGDIVGNAAYYSMVGIKPKYSLAAGAVIGLAAGIGAVALPGKMGLNEQYSNATNKTKMLAVLIYVVGGLVAGSVHTLLERKSTRKR